MGAEGVGTWWVWDVRVTASLVSWMIAVAYLLLRRYGGPGSEKLAAGLALFGMANVPFIYISVNYWRTIHPATSVVPTLPVSMGGRCGSAWRRSCCCSSCCSRCACGSRSSARV